jgi:solute carrier family 25 aspartate/glutamate transporter 12/13
VTWDDFVVFQTLLKKPDADFESVYIHHIFQKKKRRRTKCKSADLGTPPSLFDLLQQRVAFKYFDQDRNGEVTFEEFKRVFSEALRPDSLPFTFESPWVKLFLGKRSGQHVLGYK